MPPLETFYLIAAIAPMAIVAITFHEVAHGYVAKHLGDDTAYRLGRISLNPLRHIDPFGTVLLPILLAYTLGTPFGYAKPVPVNFLRLRHPKRDMALVALAGPMTNILLALLSAALLAGLYWYAPRFLDGWLAVAIDASLNLNLILALFNMVPLLPLDGGRVMHALLPDRLGAAFARLERPGLFVVIGIFLILPMLGREFGQNWDLFRWLIFEPMLTVRGWILWLFGVF